MNILLVANWESDVGYAWWLMENFWVTIARHYERQNKRCVLIYPKVNEIPKAIADSPIKVVELDFNDRSPENRRRLQRLIRDEGIGSAYLTDRPYLSPFYAFLRQAGVRRIFIHDHSPGERRPPAQPKRLVKSVLMRLPFVTADHYIGVTPYVRDRFVEIARIPPRKCSHASNGIRPQPPSEATRKRYRDWLGADDDTTVIVSTGRATYYKGIDTIIRPAAELVKQRGADKLLFLHCGDGPDRKDFEQLAADLGLGERFRFLGKRNDVRELLQGCDLAVHAAQGEVGYSLSILEYMDAGLVTFVPDRESVCQSITHGSDGYIYRDRHGLVEQIQWVLDSSAERARIARNARATVQSHYRLEQTNRRLIEVLERNHFSPGTAPKMSQSRVQG